MSEVQFVVLHHEGIANPHFDLMIETPGRDYLHTWQSRADPLATYISIAKRIQNHRRNYLTYEGPISGERGAVTRVRSGIGKYWKTSKRIWVLQYPGAGDGRFAGYLFAPAKHRYWQIEGWTRSEGDWISSELSSTQTR